MSRVALRPKPALPRASLTPGAVRYRTFQNIGFSSLGAVIYGTEAAQGYGGIKLRDGLPTMDLLRWCPTLNCNALHLPHCKYIIVANPPMFRAALVIQLCCGILLLLTRAPPSPHPPTTVFRNLRDAITSFRSLLDVGIQQSAIWWLCMQEMSITGLEEGDEELSAAMRRIEVVVARLTKEYSRYGEKSKLILLLPLDDH